MPPRETFSYRCRRSGCAAPLCGYDPELCLQAALTDAAEGEPGSRRSTESVHASRRSIGSAAADADEKPSGAVAAFNDPQANPVLLILTLLRTRSRTSRTSGSIHGVTRVGRAVCCERRLQQNRSRVPLSCMCVPAGEGGDVPAAALRSAGLAVHGDRRGCEQHHRPPGRPRPFPQVLLVHHPTGLVYQYSLSAADTCPSTNCVGSASQRVICASCSSPEWRWHLGTS